MSDIERRRREAVAAGMEVYGRMITDAVQAGMGAVFEVVEQQHAAAVSEAVAIMRDARGHYGIEETGGPGQPATEWDEIADRMQAFVHRYGSR